MQGIQSTNFHKNLILAPWFCSRNNAKQWGVGCVTQWKVGEQTSEVPSTEEFVTQTFSQGFTQPTLRLFALFLSEMFCKCGVKKLGVKAWKVLKIVPAAQKSHCQVGSSIDEQKHGRACRRRLADRFQLGGDVCRLVHQGGGGLMKKHQTGSPVLQAWTALASAAPADFTQKGVDEAEGIASPPG